MLTPRRYYLFKALAADELGDTHLAAVWRAKQLALAWPDLPSNFPGRSRLIAAGYLTVRDLDGADLDELRNLGLSSVTARAVLVAMESWNMIELIRKEYQRQDGRAATVYNAPLVPSDEYDATFTSDTMEMGDLTTLRLLLDITAASGTTPTLDVQVQTSNDGVNNWQAAGTFGQKDDVSSERFVFPGCDRFVRVVCTLGGTTPSFTFSVSGEAC